jgi:hypothetical protein
MADMMNNPEAISQAMSMITPEMMDQVSHSILVIIREKAAEEPLFDSCSDFYGGCYAMTYGLGFLSFSLFGLMGYIRMDLDGRLFPISHTHDIRDHVHHLTNRSDRLAPPRASRDMSPTIGST